MKRLGGRVNLVICQKSKIDDWVNHFKTHYPFKIGDYPAIITSDLTSEKLLKAFVMYANSFDELCMQIGVINYDLIFRRPELLKIDFSTIMLDESSMIKNDTSKRTKTILKLKTKNVILLSGTPTGGKYEELYSQLKLLGWDISKTEYWKTFVKTYTIKTGGFPLKIVTGYKNVGRLKRKMREYGCNFLKTSEVFDLPAQTFTDIKVDPPKEYSKFIENRFVCVDGFELVGDTTLTTMLYSRQLCGAFCDDKIKALGDLIESTNDRIIVFYNYNLEIGKIESLCKKLKRPISIVNGQGKNLDAYEQHENSVTLIQYQAGAMGLNLQKANKIIYYTPPLSSELYEQSKKRIHRIGQEKPCFYYRLICKKSIENDIYKTLEKRNDYTEALFKKGAKNGS